MNNIKKSASIKYYFLIISLAIGAIILLLRFYILPQLLSAITDILPGDQVKTIENRLSFIAIGYFIFVFLSNIFIWKIENGLRNEENKAQNFLNVNPNDCHAREKLRQILKKRKNYFRVIEPVIILVIGLMVGLFVTTLIIPIYQTIENIK